MEQTYLEFADGRRVKVISIYGGPELVHNAMRDTLRIEFDPEDINFDSLKSIFSDKANLDKLSSVTVGDDEVTKAVIGTGYTILASISNIVTKINPEPGEMKPPQNKEIFSVTIAQETYEEYKLRQIDGN